MSQNSERARARDEAVAAHARWGECRGVLIAEIGEAEFASWVAGLSPLGDDGKVMRIACPSRFIRDHITDHHMDAMESILERKVELVICAAARVS